MSTRRLERRDRGAAGGRRAGRGRRRCLGADHGLAGRMDVARAAATAGPRRPDRDDRHPGVAGVPAPADHLERGLSLVSVGVRRDPANPIVTLKTTSRADYVYARLEARRAGAEDALFLTIVRAPVRVDDGEHLPRPGAPPTASSSWRRRPSTARSCPARPAPGSCAGRRRRPPPRRGLADARRAGRRRRGVHVLVRGRGAAGDPVQRASRSATAGPARGPSARAPTASGSSSRVDSELGGPGHARCLRGIEFGLKGSVNRTSAPIHATRA